MALSLNQYNEEIQIKKYVKHKRWYVYHGRTAISKQGNETFFGFLVCKISQNIADQKITVVE